MSLKVFAEKSLTATTIKAMATEFRVISTDAIANFKSLDIFTDSSDFAHRFMARNQRELMNQLRSSVSWRGRYFGDEFPIMDMKIGSTNSTCSDLQLTRDNDKGEYL